MFLATLTHLDLFLHAGFEHKQKQDCIILRFDSRHQSLWIPGAEEEERRRLTTDLSAIDSSLFQWPEQMTRARPMQLRMNMFMLPFWPVYLAIDAM